MATMLLVAAAWLCGRALAATEACPHSVGRRTPDGLSNKAQVEFHNQTPVRLQVFWVNTEGREIAGSTIEPGGIHLQASSVNHVFALRAHESGILVKVYQVTRIDGMKSQPTQVVVPTCDGMDRNVRKYGKRGVDQSRWAEFEQLARDHNSPCVGHSTEWSCVRQVTPQELNERDPGRYGFRENEIARGNPYKIGSTTDHIWLEQQKWIVNVTAYEGGFLKMHMTDKMKSLLYPWYSESLRTHVSSHGEIPGFFTNSHVIPIDKIDIGEFPDILDGLEQEMMQVMTWWAKRPLQHTKTFGLRIYRRGSMVLNHLDREDTHLASAVIQVGTKADVGWPLEVIHPHKPGLVEVYLQPGEMVLYEGARILTGRPMRFQGEEFGNIFSHFKPVGWNGPTDQENPYYKQERHKLNYADDLDPDIYPSLEL